MEISGVVYKLVNKTTGRTDYIGSTRYPDRVDRRGLDFVYLEDFPDITVEELRAAEAYHYSKENPTYGGRQDETRLMLKNYEDELKALPVDRKSEFRGFKKWCICGDRELRQDRLVKHVRTVGHFKATLNVCAPHKKVWCTCGRKVTYGSLKSHRERTHEPID